MSIFRDRITNPIKDALDNQFENLTSAVKEGVNSAIDDRINGLKESVKEFFKSDGFDEICLIGVMVCVVFNIVDFPGVRKLGGMIFFVWLFVKFMVSG